MYIEDLAPFENWKGEIEHNVFAVGWLDDEHVFPKGIVAPTILENILELCLKPVNLTRGFYQSPFFKDNFIGYPVTFKGKRLVLGSAEIRVKSKNGRIYAAPNLIYHYIKDCGYLPPKEFLDALME